MQGGRAFSEYLLWSGWKQAGGYFALHVSFAHITPMSHKLALRQKEGEMFCPPGLSTLYSLLDVQR